MNAGVKINAFSSFDFSYVTIYAGSIRAKHTWVKKSSATTCI